MKMRQRFFFFCASVATLFLASCSNEIPEEKISEREGRTVLAYLVANNNLSTYLKNNVIWMYEGLSSMTDACTLLIYYRPRESDSTFEGPTLMKFITDGEGNINGVPALSGSITIDDVLEVAEKKVYTDNGSYVAVDPSVMLKVFQDMQEVAPSKSYGLIFGSHASSWMEGNSVQTMAFGVDNGYNIDIPDLADVLQSSFSDKLDFILFDACMMGTAEVGYELRNVTDYLIGSVMETPVYGFPYDRILPTLYGDTSGFSQVCSDFISYNKENDWWGTCALMDCSQMEQLADAVKETISEADFSSFDYHDVQQYGYSGNSYKYFSFDVGDFFRVLNDGIVPETIQSALNKAVVAKYCLSGSEYAYGNVVVDESRFCGIGMYYPDQGINTSWDEYYSTSVAWYQAAGWGSLQTSD